MMDRSGRAGRNRRKPVETPARWARLVKPKAIANACGRALRRLSTVAVALVVLGGISGAAWAGYHFATTSLRFAIQSIAVHGNRHVTEQHVVAMLPLALGDNVFRVDLDAVTHALRSSPWIADAEAHRILPDTIRVDVQEHVPVALADLGGLYLVDATGRPFKRAAVEAGEATGLPVVTGISRSRFTANPQDAQRLIGSALRALEMWRTDTDRPPIGEIHISPFGGLTFRTYDVATAIQLGVIDPTPHSLLGSAGHPGRAGVIDAVLRLRFRSFDTTWAELGETERARARAIHVDSHSDHVTVALAKDQ